MSTIHDAEYIKSVSMEYTMYLDWENYLHYFSGIGCMLRKYTNKCLYVVIIPICCQKCSELLVFIDSNHDRKVHRFIHVARCIWLLLYTIRNIYFNYYVMLLKLILDTHRIMSLQKIIEWLYFQGVFDNEKIIKLFNVFIVFTHKKKSIQNSYKKSFFWLHQSKLIS